MHEDTAATQIDRPATRPALHLTTRSGWINDPMGLTYHDGRYHMFFQYVPAQIHWGPQCWWGHAVSEDLLSWTECEPILRPGDGDGGCWSGSLAVDDAGRATIFYTSVQLDDLDLGQIRTAQPDDLTWNTWQKGPFVDGIKPTNDIMVFRDPQVSRDANGWQMIVGAGRRDDTAVALSYRSPDLLNWTSEGEFASRSSAVRDPVWTGKVWECPQLITIGNKHVLLFSVWEPQILHYEAYAIGSVSNGQFISEKWGRLSYGDQYYAGATFSDANGRPGIIYWLRGITDSGGLWAGAHSVPHLLRVDDSLGLIAEPHPAVGDRRGPATKIESGSSDPVALPPLADVDWDLSPGQLATLSVSSTDATPMLTMISNDDDLQIKIADTSWTMPLSPRVRLVFDGPVVEVFGNAGVFAAAIPVAGARTISMTNSSGLIYPL